MVVNLKKLAVILYHREKDAFLTELQRMGIIHISEEKTSESTCCKETYGKIKRCERVIKSISDLNKGTETSDCGELRKSHPDIVIETFDALENTYRSILNACTDIRGRLEKAEPWGEFDTKIIASIEESGIKIAFFEATEKTFDLIPDKNGTIAEISRKEGLVYFVSIGEELDLSKYQVKKLSPPSSPLKDVYEEEKKILNEKETYGRKLTSFRCCLPILEDYKARLSDRLKFEKAIHQMEEKGLGELLILRGWLPAEDEKKLSNFMLSHGVYFQISTPEKEDRPPVLLKNNAFSRLFEPVTNIFSLPSYRELDPTPYFSPFFALFFGLCLADLGYGLIIALIMAVMIFRGPSRLKPVFVLGTLLGVFTILGGLILNTAFGNAIFVMPGSQEGFFRSGQEFAPLSPFAKGGQTVFPAMPFALMLGVIQVVLGITLQAVNMARQNGFLYSLQPLSFLLIIAGLILSASQNNIMGMAELEIGPLILGPHIKNTHPFLGKAALISGLAVLFFFNNPASKIFVRPALGLWELYGFVTGLMGDILSYLRLFALGLAGGLLGNAFNSIAFMFISGENGTYDYISFGMVGTILVLLFGHTLNLGLATLGGFVHSLRLTFVEFYKNLKFTGGGQPFSHFSRNSWGQTNDGTSKTKNAT